MQRPSAGDLNRRAVIRRWQEFPDVVDGIDQSFPEVARVWSKVEPVGGGIYYGSVQTGNMVTHRITIRRRQDVTAEHVIDADGRRYRVKRSADLGTAREFTVLDVEELGGVP
ncbi:phage head closure protein [Azospirillum tabaci]|uniref:phage head closure protein n=1 Tax=Azospirillum tabaci TaxID=2752310 RepID=UPI001660525D|nr:phage head closure protein [Azospirillum tabaci]